MILGSLTGNHGNSSRTLTIGGSGDIQITGATSVGTGTGSYGIVKAGGGSLTFGSSLAGFGRVLAVNDGTFDLNGNAYTSTQAVTMGGAVSTLGAEIVTGAAGSLNLGAGLTFSNRNTPPGAVITGIVRLAAADQIHNGAVVSIGAADESLLELANFTETIGALTITQSDASDFSGVKTGATGTLVLNGNLIFNNNSNSSGADGREVLITGTGSESTPAFDGFLDLGGATRTIHVATTTVGTNEPKANATIETQILNGGILKTGPRTLFLNNPNNTFAGGLQIAGGTVKSGGGTSLGLGPVTFTNAPGVAAGLDFGTLAGPIADNFSLTGAGDVTFAYSGLAPNMLTLSGDFTTSQNLYFDVVNGSTADGDSATLDLTGTIDDAASTINLTKIGNGNFTRALGTGPGEVQFATATGGGWAAHGTDRSVNLGGAGDTVVWGLTSPAFLYKSVPGNDYGALVLGSATGTHTVEFQNPIELNNGTKSVLRDLVVNNGPAAIDARISGGISQSADPELTFTSLDLEGDGTLEISGPLSGGNPSRQTR